MHSLDCLVSNLGCSMGDQLASDPWELITITVIITIKQVYYIINLM